jgi:hypothetical protein
VQEGGTGGATAFRLGGGNFTSAELMTIVNNPSLLQKTIFYNNGEVMKTSELLKMIGGIK